MPEVPIQTKLRFVKQRNFQWLRIIGVDCTSELCQIFTYNFHDDKIQYRDFTVTPVPNSDTVRVDATLKGEFSILGVQELRASFTLPLWAEKSFRLFGPFVQFAVAQRPDGDHLAAAWVEATEWVAADGFVPQQY